MVAKRQNIGLSFISTRGTKMKMHYARKSSYVRLVHRHQCSRSWIHLAESVLHDQTAHTCSLILPCTLRCAVNNLPTKPSSNATEINKICLFTSQQFEFDRTRVKGQFEVKCKQRGSKVHLNLHREHHLKVWKCLYCLCKNSHC